MNNKSSYLLIIFIIINISKLVSQPTFKEPLYDRPIPPSPTSSLFRQFAGYTPSLSTGSVNVPIPLYDVKAGGFTLPISLQYYTSGVKLSDIAYPVGYGWLLNPGLRITRTIMGRPDGLSYPMKIYDLQQINQWSDQERFNYCKRALYDGMTNHANVGALHDTEYDIFTIHLPVGNYSFIIKDNKVVTAGNKLNITPLYSGQKIKGFEVRDESGIIYSFGKLASETDCQNCTEHTRIQYFDDPTAWALRKIKLPGTLNEISLSWSQRFVQPYFNGGYVNSVTVLDYKDIISHCSSPDSEPSGSESFDYGNAGSIVLMLDKIDFPLGSLSFKYKAYDTPYLTNMTVTSKSNEVTKSVDFSYEKNGDALLLSSLNITGEGLYTFTYNPNRFDHINKQDYWGYYNGKQNASLIPRMKIPIYRNYRDNGSYSEEYGAADRSIDKDKMQANILTRVDYPTGGFTAFEYEPHRFEGQETNWINGLPYFDPAYTISLKEGGGLRVSKVTTQTDATSTPTIKTYKYGKSENGLGKITYAPTLDTFIDEYMAEYLEVIPPCGPGQIPYTTARYCRMLNIYAQSKNSQLFMTNPPVFYDFVTEYTNNTNKTEYSFSPTNIDEIGHLLIFKRYRPFVRKYNNLFNKGSQLINKTAYIFKNNKYEPIENISYKYALIQESPVMGIYIGRSGINMADDGPDFYSLKGLSDGLRYGTKSPSVEAVWYTYLNTYLDISYNELTSEEQTLYTEQGTIKKQVNYKYNVHSNLLRSKETISSGGTKVTDSYLYPFDYSSTEALSQKSILQAMSEQNILATPFYISQTINGATTEKYIEYKNWGNNLFLPEKVYLQTKGNPKDLRLTYHQYDSYGNPIHLSKDGLTNIVYLWGYNGQYPIAEIQNATYSDVKTALGGTAPESLSAALSPDMTKLGTMRNNLLNAHVTTYTHRLLVGTSTINNPLGQTSRYFYDSYGRLESIADNNNKLQQRYSYNYAAANPFTVSMSAASEYLIGNSNRFSVAVYDGSGKFTYDWYLKNASGTVIKQSIASSNNYFDITFDIKGNMTLTCKVKDTITGKVMETTKSFNVKLPPVEFLNVQSYRGSSPWTIAEVYCAEATDVSFLANGINFGLEVQGQLLSNPDFGLNYEMLTCRLPKGTSQIILHAQGYDFNNSYRGFIQIYSANIGLGPNNKIDIYF